MGGKQSSTRKLTVENDEPPGVVRISQDVAQRISNSQEPRAAPQPEQQHQQQPPQGSPVVPPPAFFYQPNVSTVQLRQCNVEELKKNDKYWENRLKQMKENHHKIENIMECEYRKACKDLESNKHVIEAKQNMPPCLESKESVLKCYREHCKEPIRCAKVVKEFQDCVDIKRTCIIESRG